VKIAEKKLVKRLSIVTKSKKNDAFAQNHVQQKLVLLLDGKRELRTGGCHPSRVHKDHSLHFIVSLCVYGAKSMSRKKFCIIARQQKRSDFAIESVRTNGCMQMMF